MVYLFFLEPQKLNFAILVAFAIFTMSCFQQANSRPMTALEIMQGKGECIICHSLDGSKEQEKIAPTFKGIFGKKTTVLTREKERVVLVDEDYVKSSILNPGEDIVKGYPNVMRSYRGVLTNREINLVVEYIKNCK